MCDPEAGFWLIRLHYLKLRPALGRAALFTPTSELPASRTAAIPFSHLSRGWVLLIPLAHAGGGGATAVTTCLSTAIAGGARLLACGVATGSLLLRWLLPSGAILRRARCHGLLRAILPSRRWLLAILPCAARRLTPILATRLLAASIGYACGCAMGGYTLRGAIRRLGASLLPILACSTR